MTSRGEEERKDNVLGEGRDEPSGENEREGGRLCEETERCWTGLRCLALICILYDAS